MTKEDKISMHTVGLMGVKTLTDAERDMFVQIYGCASRFSELLHALVAHCLHSSCTAC